MSVVDADDVLIPNHHHHRQNPSLRSGDRHHPSSSENRACL